MSYVFDVMARVYAEKVRDRVEDPWVAHLFSVLIEAMHDANHRLKDAVNHDPQVSKAARELDNHNSGKLRTAREALHGDKQGEGSP